MPKLTVTPPSYRHHKPSGRAVVTLNGKDHYLGPWQSPASRAEYKRLLAEWMAVGQIIVPAEAPVTSIIIAELLAHI